MKNKNIVNEEECFTRWLYHADHDPRIVESNEIKKSLKEGWKFWPWEVEDKKEENKDCKKKDSSICSIEEIDFPISSNQEVKIVNENYPVQSLESTVDK